MRSAFRASSVADDALYSNFTDMRSPALMFSPVNPASSTFSQSAPKINLLQRYSLAVMSKLCSADA